MIDNLEIRFYVGRKVKGIRKEKVMRASFVILKTGFKQHPNTGIFIDKKDVIYVTPLNLQQ